MKNHRIPSYTEAQDDKDYVAFMRGGDIDAEVVKWLDDFKIALMELGFDDWSAQNVIDDSGLKLRYDLDPEYFAESLRFCDCGWVGTMDELVSATGLKFDVELICCPDCGEII